MTLLLFALACSSGEAPEPEAQDAGLPDIAPVDLAARIEAGAAPVVLDVRTEEEFGDGHVPGARHIPHSELGERWDELNAHRESELVVYCESGRRAEAAREILEAQGFTQVRYLDGHMARWREEGRPTETPESAAAEAEARAGSGRYVPPPERAARRVYDAHRRAAKRAFGR